MQQTKYFKNSGDIIEVDGNTFEKYLVRYGSKSDRDLQREFFSLKTYFMLKAGYPIKGAPVNYQHGLDDDFGNLPIGLFTFVDEDEIGLFVRGQLHALEQYEDMLKELGRVKGLKLGKGQLQDKAGLAVKTVEELVKNIPLRFSMGADIATYKVNEETGHIDQCGIVHGAFTPTPADDKNPVIQFKNAWQQVINLQSEKMPIVVNLDPGVTPDSGPPLLDKNEEKIMGKKSWKAMTPEERDMVLSEVGAVLDVLVESTEMPVDEALRADMTDEMKENLENVEDEEEEEEDANKQDEPLTEEDVEQIVQENLAEILPEELKKFMLKKTTATKRRHKSAKAALASVQKTVPTTSKKESVGGITKIAPAPTPLDDYVLSEYDEYTSDDMTLGVKMAYAIKYGSSQHLFRKRAKLDELVSPEYIKAMFCKIKEREATHVPLKALGYKDRMLANDRRVWKSAMPYKADELDAVDITNQGAEWVFIDYDMRLWERVRPITSLVDLLAARGMRTMDVKGTSMNVKLNTGSPTVYTAPEARSIDSSGRPEVTAQITPFTTDEVQVDLKEHKLASSHTKRLEEQSLISIAQFVNEDAMIAMRESQESVFINGDTTTTSSNINTTTAPTTGLQTPDYIAFDGIRHNVLVDNTSKGNASGSVVELIDYEATIQLHDNAILNRTAEMLFLIDSRIQSETRRFPEYLTRDVADNLATAFADVMPSPFGVDIYMSTQLGLALATGFISDTSGSNTRGQIINVYAPYWQYGRQRQIQVDTVWDALSGSTVVVVSVSHVLAARGASAATMTYNLVAPA